MKRFAKLAVAGIGAAGLLMSQVPAQAAQVGAVAFVGSATVNPGLYYPLPGNPGSTGTWSFNLGTAVGVAATTSPTAAAVGTAAGSVGGSLKAGDVQQLVGNGLNSGGFCGASGGYGGTGNISVTDAATLATLNAPVAGVGWVQSVATVIAFTGDTTGTGDAGGNPELVGVVSAIPTTGSCTNGTATAFTVVGAGAVVDLT